MIIAHIVKGRGFHKIYMLNVYRFRYNYFTLYSKFVQGVTLCRQVDQDNSLW